MLKSLDVSMNGAYERLAQMYRRHKGDALLGPGGASVVVEGRDDEAFALAVMHSFIVEEVENGPDEFIEFVMGLRPITKPRRNPENPPTWVRDEDTWERAKEAVADRWDSYRDPWAVVTTVYEQMGGRRK